jgi:hypothetical protein
MSGKRLYTVRLAFSPTERLGHQPGVRAERDYVVEADTEAEAFDEARRQLTTELLIEAANVKPWAVSYTVGGDRRVSETATT